MSLQQVTNQDGVAGKACDWFIYRVVAETFHTRGQNVGATFCHCYVSDEFKPNQPIINNKKYAWYWEN